MSDNVCTYYQLYLLPNQCIILTCIFLSQQQQDRRYRNSQQGQQQYRRRNNNSNVPKQEGPKREAILDLNKYKDQDIRVKLIGGRQITGTLKGFDQLMNLVLENVQETLRGMYI